MLCDESSLFDLRASRFPPRGSSRFSVYSAVSPHLRDSLSRAIPMTPVLEGIVNGTANMLGCSHVMMRTCSRASYWRLAIMLEEKIQRLGHETSLALLFLNRQDGELLAHRRIEIA